MASDATQGTARPAVPAAPTETGQRAGEAPPAARPSALSRVATWDNARFLVMVLVVFGHLVESIRGTPAVDALYAVIYAFHMPAFLLMSGVFASSEALTPKRLARTAQLLATWLVVEFAWVLGRLATGETPFPDTFLVMPKWACWFLVSLFLMRVLLPYIALLPHPLVLSFLVALGAGLIPSIGQEFSASRTLALMPFFLIGWAIRQRGIDRRPWFHAPSVRLRLLAALTFAAAGGAVLLLMTLPQFTLELLFWRRSYEAMDLGSLQGLALRGGMLVIALAMTFAVLLLVPRRVHWFTKLGENSLYVYLLHIPIVTVLRAFDVDERIGNASLSVVLALALAIGLTVLLSQPFVKRLTGWALEPMWLFRRGFERRPG